MNTTYDVLGIGNAIVDVLSRCDDKDLRRLNLRKGAMTLINEARAVELYEEMGPSTACSGGSTANTLAGLASLGASTSFIGKVRNDQLGEIFEHDLNAVGVDFSTAPATDGPATARCLIFVTPDAQRTMQTYIGACVGVSEGDITPEHIASAAIIYVEGYLWDQEGPKAAIRRAIELAKQANRKVAFTLSDVFCVDRHRAEFLELIRNQVDILFSNENELLSLFVGDDFDTALWKLRQICPLAAITRSANGAIVATKDKAEAVQTSTVNNVIDTTGAGDLFASGFLYGLSKGWNLRDCAQLGNRCAGHIIQQMGARSMMPLGKLVA